MSYACKSLINTSNELASREKRLSICLEAGGFSFAEVTLKGQVLTLGEAEGHHAYTLTGVMSDVKEFFSQVNIRPLGYAQMELIVLSDISTWVPDELYSSLSNRHYMKLVGGGAESILSCHSQQLSSTAIYAADEQVVTAFKVAMPGVNVMHQHAKLAQMAPLSVQHPLMVAHWRKGRVDVAAFRDGKYLFGNTLQFNYGNEAVYHLIDIMKSHGLEDADMELMLCGDANRERYAACLPYFPKVTIFSPIDLAMQAAEFRGLPAYRHTLILL